MGSRLSAVVVVTLASLLTACSQSRSATSSAATEPGRPRLAVRMVGRTCEPVTLAAGAGQVEFDLSNRTTSAASFQVLSGDHVVGQVERLGAGLAGELSLDLNPGTYRIECQVGAQTTAGQLRLGGATGSVALGQSPDLLLAADGYRAFLTDRADGLVSSLTALQASVAAGDLAGARLQYASARAQYGQLEPAADNFGDAEPAGQANLAVAIDGPVEAGPGDPPQGLRRLEQGLWGSASVTSLAPTVSAVRTDAVNLRSRIGAMHFDAVELAGGSGDELSQAITQVTSAPASRPASLDIIDLQAAADGARAVLAALHPALVSRDGALDATVAQRLAQLDAAVSAVAANAAGAAASSSTWAGMVSAGDALADAMADMAPVLIRPAR